MEQILEFVGGEAMGLCCLRSIAKSRTQVAGRRVLCSCGASFLSGNLNPRDRNDLSKMVTRGLVFVKGWAEQSIAAWFLKHKDRYRLTKVDEQAGIRWLPQAPEAWCNKADRRCVVLEKGILALFYGRAQKAPDAPFAPVDLLKDEPGVWVFDGAEFTAGKPAEKTDARHFEASGSLAPADGHTHRFSAPIDMAGDMVAISTVTDNHTHIVKVGAFTPGEFSGLSTYVENPLTGVRHRHEFTGMTGPTQVTQWTSLADGREISRA